ncbi:HAD-IC family P-type ATPase [Sulfitobacter sp. S190]|uniref:cation-translocating P-type ATPase n=1 Tax=Sulfitobacter sp. S190 TaxID=2867022 RepID=UPI0021A4AA05|nr:HAD-IC family P-type ATPase [Sulfitobacter sp. S190]UWR21829.1 HAD-IC family P-type ATPase [Sulfitobacter sp. S190]
MSETARLTGLTEQEVAKARETFGANTLPSPEQAGPLSIVVRQFKSLLVLILFGAAIVALALGEMIDAATIAVVVVLNAALGFVQEWKAETALAALRKLLSPQAMVLRDGQEQLIPAQDIVPGDMLVLSPGVKIVADAMLVRAVNVSVDESILTGESLPVSKGMTEGDRLVYAGTSVIEGRAFARVTAIGGMTEFGKIAHLTGSVGAKTTNLQHKLGHLARQLGLAAVLVAGGVAVLGLAMGRNTTEMVMTGLSLAVAMVPEGLPAVVTITLALGATAMVRQKALVRKLQAVETLGAASVICTDKTGTLTENKMTATRIWTLARAYDVTGTGYDPAGQIETEGARVRAADDPVLAALLRVCLSCTHARLIENENGWQTVGAPTEGALLTLGHKGWDAAPEPKEPIAEIPFNSARKRMSVLQRFGEQLEVLTKGAPEQVLEICTQVMTPDGPRPLCEDETMAIEKAYTRLAREGLRVMAFAMGAARSAHIEERDLTFLGLVGMIDPPRGEVRDAIGMARSAGIRVIMITGDSPVTAEAIARQLSLDITTRITGPDLAMMDEKILAGALKTDPLFARTKPDQKMRIVSALQAQGQIVAMTGDGVNDAPALRKADIGISMGVRGTDVARDASDLVLLDDNFATIVRAISEGRRQFANVQKFVRYLLSSNAGEVIALVVNIAIGGPLVFLATQILWMNLVTDGVTAVALGLEKAEPDQMQQPPRAKQTPILGRSGILTILMLGTYTGLSSLWIFFHLLDAGVELARTTAFTAMVLFEKISVFAFRSLRLPVWRIGWFSNPFLLAALCLTIGAQIAAVYWPPLQTLLRTVPIGVWEWSLIAMFALPILIVPEFYKLHRYRAT